MAEIVVFPSIRRVGSIRKVARTIAQYRAEGAERTLAHRLRQHRGALERLGLDANTVAADTRALEIAIRAEVARLARVQERA